MRGKEMTETEMKSRHVSMGGQSVLWEGIERKRIKDRSVFDGLDKVCCGNKRK